MELQQFLEDWILVSLELAKFEIAAARGGLDTFHDSPTWSWPVIDKEGANTLFVLTIKIKIHTRRTRGTTLSISGKSWRRLQLGSRMSFSRMSPSLGAAGTSSGKEFLISS